VREDGARFAMSQQELYLTFDNLRVVHVVSMIDGDELASGEGNAIVDICELTLVQHLPVVADAISVLSDDLRSRIGRSVIHHDDFGSRISLSKN
jgi:hypothetical protein